MTAKACGACAGDKPLASMNTSSRALAQHDAQIDIAYRGARQLAPLDNATLAA
jgi:hypothetical protein